MYLIVSGTPADGFRYYGPFPDAETANEWADHALATKDTDWWACDLNNPSRVN